MHQLFHQFAHRYDLHTPRGHYQHDHAFVIREALRVAPANCHLLDIGCGTGVFLEAAIEAGIDGYGIDASVEMIAVAQKRLRANRVSSRRMQEIDEENAYEVICALSWSIHYCVSEAELCDVIGRCRRALRPGGLVLLQVANDDYMTGAVNIDREPGPSGEPEDTYFIHRFSPVRDAQHHIVADYVYASRAHRELLSEQHELPFANPSIFFTLLVQSGFKEVRIVNSNSVSPFVVGTHA